MGINFHNSQNLQNYHFDMKIYCREFRPHLTTYHGVWSHREGILIRLEETAPADFGKVGWGEIAPLPGFGSENLTEALEFCESWGGRITADVIATIPDNLPACQFGFESALINLSDSKFTEHSWEFCGLLPTGKEALNLSLPVWQSNYRTLKWKIAVQSMAEEMALFQELLSVLPEGVRLRLDANGGLGIEEARQWLAVCAEAPVEFFEQPLPVREFEQMRSLSQEYPTAIALDESVATFRQLVECHQQGWEGVIVLKPAILGFPSRLRAFCQRHRVDLVLSSVFETVIGRRAILNLATTLPNLHRPLGFGINHWFADES